MTLSTLPRYLIGRESAIREVIESRGVLLLGFLFVLSAGFAREYDGEDLVAEPWHLLIPLGASVVSCAILYLLLLLVARRDKEYPLRPVERFTRFLGLYWMTAPLAWLYAIPVERWLSPVDAMEFNLYLLGIVALWRVLLISRGAAVLFGTTFKHTIFPVVLFGDVLMLIILAYTPVPILQIMGGVRLSPTEALLQDVTSTATFWGVFSFPVWAIGTLAIWSTSLEEGESWRPIKLASRRHGTSASLWGLGIAALLIWIPILPKTQPPLRLRNEVDTLLRQGEIEQAVGLMSAHQREDFPPIWDPAPRPAFRENFPPLHLVLHITRDPATAPWVRELYVDKVARQFESPYGNAWGRLRDDEFEEYAEAIAELPSDSAVLQRTATEWKRLLGNEGLSEELRELILTQLGKWGIDPTPPPSSIDGLIEHLEPDEPSSDQATQDEPEPTE